MKKTSKKQYNIVDYARDNPIASCVYIVFLAAFMLLFVHADLMETANHSYLFLEELFSGRFFSFYLDLDQHANSFYYLNSANYNIAFYALMAVWELPVFVINKLGGLVPNEPVIWLWSKLYCVIFFVLSSFVFMKITELVTDRKSAVVYQAAYLFNPVLFFFAALGFYDFPMLTFTLLGIYWFLRGNDKKFCIYMGVAALFKIFALFIFVPMVLLKKKDLIREIIPSLLLGAAPYILTTLLFFGRSGDSSIFMQTMKERVFESSLGYIPFFLTSYLLICIYCFMKKAGDSEQALLRLTAQIGFAVYGTFFLFVTWHPQWIILIIPFSLLMLINANKKTLFYYLMPYLFFSVLLYAWTAFPTHFEPGLTNWGILHFFIPSLHLAEYRPITHYLAYVLPVSAYKLFSGSAIISFGVFFMVCGKSGKNLCDRLSDSSKLEPVSCRIIHWTYIICMSVFCLSLIFCMVY